MIYIIYIYYIFFYIYTVFSNDTHGTHRHLRLPQTHNAPPATEAAQQYSLIVWGSKIKGLVCHAFSAPLKEYYPGQTKEPGWSVIGTFPIGTKDQEQGSPWDPLKTPREILVKPHRSEFECIRLPFLMPFFFVLL